MVFRFFLFVLAAVFSFQTLSLSAQGTEATGGLEQRDIEALRDWINTKRQVTVKERGGNLSISGEVRGELQSTNEKVNGIKQRGSGGAVANTPLRAWDVEVNLMLDYRTDRTWAAVKLEFDNNTGTETGTYNRLSVERAYLGGRIVNANTYTIDGWIGRWFLGYVFDSKVQFGSFMDGILFKYDQAWETLGSFYFHAGPFVVNENIDQYAYVAEIALLNIAHSGFYSKLSFIDWDTKSLGGSLSPKASSSEQERAIHDRQYRFRNVQAILGYKMAPDWFGRMMTFYAGGVMNTAAKKLDVTRDRRANFAAYAGFSLGELRKKLDWSLDVNYQWVQAQSVPSFDVSGIGRGNAAGVGFYSTKKNGKGTPHRNSSQPVGNTNFQGISVEFLYLLTSNITVYQSWRQSCRFDQNIGPAFNYKQYEVEFIYGF